MKVEDINARIIFTSSSKPTLEIELKTKKGRVKASVPFGTSAGSFEVKNLEPKLALRVLSQFKDALKWQEWDSIIEVDEFLKRVDGTGDFSKIGGNLALAISIAFLKAFALEEGVEVFEYLSKKPKIPLPLCNVVGTWEKKKTFQEFLLFPKHQKSFFDSIERISQAYHEISKKLRERDKSFNFGRNWESAWVCNLTNEEILEILEEISKNYDLFIGLDVAANNLYENEYYHYINKKLNRMEQLNYLEELVKNFKIKYVEDPFEENDFVSFSTLQARLPNTLICGDDLLVTNLKRLRAAIDLKAVRAVIIKPNQVGTLSDTLKFFEEAKKHGLKTVVSHRSSETDDNFLAHLAVGLGSDFAKIGISGERIVKINEFIRIEEKVS